MGTEETHALGYERVDGEANISVLLATMDATARWEATLRLREWERHQLRLKRGQRLLDVGCGLGDAGLALAAGLGEAGELVGVDVSNEMVAVAQSRAIGVRVDDPPSRPRRPLLDGAHDVRRHRWNPEHGWLVSSRGFHTAGRRGPTSPVVRVLSGPSA